MCANTCFTKHLLQPSKLRLAAVVLLTMQIISLLYKPYVKIISYNMSFMPDSSFFISLSPWKHEGHVMISCTKKI